MCAEQLRSRLTGALIGLARATEGNEYLCSDSTAAVMVAGLCADEDFGHDVLLEMLQRVDDEKRKLVPSCYVCAAPCGRTDNFDMDKLQSAPEETRAAKLRLLTGSRDLAASLAQGNEAVHNFLYKALFAIGMED